MKWVAGTSGQTRQSPIGRAFTVAFALAIAVASGRAAEDAVATTNAPAVRHLIVVEDASTMDRQREAAADAVSRLILSGFGGRARRGDWVEIWLVSDNLDAASYPAFGWEPGEAMDRSNHAFRFLRALKGSASSAALGQVLSTALGTQPAGSPLVLYLATSGKDPLVGTPFDNPVNAIFAQHGDRLQKAGTPFLSVLVGVDGRWIEHGVTPGDRTPYIPPLPAKPQPAAPLGELAAAAPPARPPSSPPAATNQPRSMTVEEITRKLEEANLERARTNPQPVIVSVPQDPVPPPTVDPEVTPAVPASDVDTNKPAANRLEEIPEPPPIEPSPPLPAPSLTTPALSSNPPPAMIASGAQPEWERTRLIRPPVDAVSVAAGVRSPWRDFGIGAALLVAAGALLVVLVRNVRRGNRPSLITESFQRRDPPMGSQGSRS